MSAYNFIIKYRSGKTNVDADVLSRLNECDSDDIVEVSHHTVKALCNHSSVAYINTISCYGDESEDKDEDTVLDFGE